MTFTDKDLRALPATAVGSRQLKRYLIDQPSRRLEPEVVAAAEAMVPSLVAPNDGTPATGWVVVHRGADNGAYLLVYSWVWDNVVELHYAAAGQPVLGCADDDPTHFTEMVKPWIGCIWELAVLEHERSAWARHLLTPARADLVGYLADVRHDGPVGR